MAREAGKPDDFPLVGDEFVRIGCGFWPGPDCNGDLGFGSCRFYCRLISSGSPRCPWRPRENACRIFWPGARQRSCHPSSPRCGHRFPECRRANAKSRSRWCLLPPGFLTKARSCSAVTASSEEVGSSRMTRRSGMSVTVKARAISAIWRLPMGKSEMASLGLMPWPGKISSALHGPGPGSAFSSQSPSGCHARCGRFRPR